MNTKLAMLLLALLLSPLGRSADAPVPEMVWIPPGTFLMGMGNTGIDDGPQTIVTLTKGFFIGKYETTQGEYFALMGNNPSYFNGIPDCSSSRWLPPCN